MGWVGNDDCDDDVAKTRRQSTNMQSNHNTKSVQTTKTRKLNDMVERKKEVCEMEM